VRFDRSLLIAWITFFCASSSALALEKHAVAVDDSMLDSWSAGTTCRLSYYNICTGWIWCWNIPSHDERIGVVVDNCCPDGESASLLQSTFFLCTSTACYASPPGWGFTGMVAIHGVDANDCPVGAPIAAQAYCPGEPGSGPVFSTVSWGGISVPSRFAMVVTIADRYAIGNDARWGSDHPAVGSTGPQSCGLCFPVDRVTRSYQWGTASNPLCPGERFNDGVCDAELFWDFDFACTVSVQESTWGAIKALYR
jgi:hypothetical protein